jgi:hypothetical protein
MNLAASGALALVWITCAAALVYLSSACLPGIVAGNFAHGKPTGFTSRETYRALMSALVFVAPLLVYCGIVWLPRAIPRLLWPRNRELDPARRGHTLAEIERFGLLISCIVALFGVAMHTVNIRANTFSPPYFEAWPRWSLLLAWLVFIAAIVAVYLRRFRRAL